MSPSTKILHLPVSLPHELIDTILSALIALYHDDPAYQWTHLRHITRFHKSQIEHHFLHFWVPALTLTVYESKGYGSKFAVQYKAYSRSKKSQIVRFKPRDGWQAVQDRRDEWQDVVMRTTYPADDEERREKRLIIRLGVGVMNKGFTGGGIISDIMVPELRVDAYRGDLSFDWIKLFTKLSGEEMVMRRFRDKLLDAFIPTIRATLPEKRQTAIHKHLHDNYQIQRRQMLTHYRDHITSSSSAPFDIIPYLKLPKFNFWHLSNPASYPTIFDITYKEQSMVFQIPGWESWNVRQVARLRAEEEPSLYNFFPCEEHDAATKRFIKEMKDRWNGMMGKKEVDEDILEKHLEKQLREKLPGCW